MRNNKYKILHFSNLTKSMEFTVQRNSICGGSYASPELFSVEVHDPCLSGDDAVLVTYPFFSLDATGKATIIFDDALDCLCAGRYILKFYYDCVQFDEMQMQLGAMPVVTSDVTLVESNAADCLPDMGSLADSVPLIEPEFCGCGPECIEPETCCPKKPCRGREHYVENYPDTAEEPCDAEPD